MIVLNIKNWNENKVVQLEENWTLEWKQGNFEPRNLGMKTFLPSSQGWRDELLGTMKHFLINIWTKA